MIGQEIWSVEDMDGSEDTEEILSFLLIEFSRIFGCECMSAERCVVNNDFSAPCPMLITNCTPICIRLVQPMLSYWSQTIFQLSHELCHYAIRQHKTDKDFTLSWFEEIVCEATSLYFLEYAHNNWHSCTLSKRDLHYGESIKVYLLDQLCKSGTNVFSQCTTLERLAEYEKCKALERETHRNERNIVYQALSAEPDNLSLVCDYTMYLREDALTLDFECWNKEHGCNLLQVLCNIQPIKENSHV